MNDVAQRQKKRREKAKEIGLYRFNAYISNDAGAALDVIFEQEKMVDAKMTKTKIVEKLILEAHKKLTKKGITK